jgi:uncharacterized protein YdeI (YjbR/CyaY-like superfamily)
MNLETLLFPDQAAWERWLSEHYGQADGIWLKIAKKASPTPSVNYDGALDVALCYGWIDGQMNTFDEHFYVQKFTPRRPKSMWSKRNIEKIAQLSAAGLMQPPGLAQVEAAKADGRWDQAYDKPSQMSMPDDFKAILEANPKAKAFYETLNKTNTYAILWRIQTAKKPETRAARIQKLIAMLEAGEKLH